ncbi:MAG: hypothetical protein DYG94_03970 [Leptolyngbya sp. PLA3]|nr:hypothetical protein [Leptolyngbya sp. PL-A3]GIK17842.1 MAG: hypothetical protein BroJett004_00060 [Planctomycetota bacterium]
MRSQAVGSTRRADPDKDTQQKPEGDYHAIGVAAIGAPVSCVAGVNQREQGKPAVYLSAANCESFTDAVRAGDVSDGFAGGAV